MKLDMNGRDWRFVEGPWTQGPDGVIDPPENLGDQNLAVYGARAWRDFEAEFEFRWNVWGNAGFVFRAADAAHYYTVHFPVVGQQRRAEHFWALVSKVDARGWAKVLRMEMVHGVTSQYGVWHHAKVAVRGDEIRVWVDGRPVTPVTDRTYSQSGYVGLSAFSGLGAGAKASFRNLCIEGEPVAAPAYDDGVKPRQNWFLVSDKGGHGCTNIVRAANGELVTGFVSSLTGPATPYQIRSRDNGLTWTVDGNKASTVKGSMRLAPDGSLERYDLLTDPPFRLSREVSRDDGRSWSDPAVVAELSFPPEFAWRNLYANRLLETRDGTLCLFLCALSGPGSRIIRGRWYQDAPLPTDAAYCLRSTDGGRTWSEPIDIDGGVHDDKRWMIGKECDEISAAQTRDGRILVLVRPVRSPVMWETWSDDGGASWQALTRGPFPMYACVNSMIATTSGALVIGGRFPGMGLQVSHDDGMSWQGYMIDSAMWANGAMFEVEPDVVLFIYGGKDNPCELRGQFIRIAPDGAEPHR